MSDIRSILALEPVPFEWRGQKMLLRRPTLLDLVDATEANEKGGGYARAWSISRHALDASGIPLFSTPEAAMACPLALAMALHPRIEELYSEGSN